MLKLHTGLSEEIFEKNSRKKKIRKKYRLKYISKPATTAGVFKKTQRAPGGYLPSVAILKASLYCLQNRFVSSVSSSTWARVFLAFTSGL